MKQTQLVSVSVLRLAALAALFAPLGLMASPPTSTWSDAVPDADTENSVEGGCPHESRNGLTM
jgi:hypothetical protein